MNLPVFSAKYIKVVPVSKTTKSSLSGQKLRGCDRLDLTPRNPAASDQASLNLGHERYSLNPFIQVLSKFYGRLVSPLYISQS